MAMNSFKKMIMMANQALKKQNRVYWNQQAKESIFAKNCTYKQEQDAYIINPNSQSSFSFYKDCDYKFGEVAKKIITFDYEIVGEGNVRLSCVNVIENGTVAGSGEINPSLAHSGTRAYIQTAELFGSSSQYYRFGKAGVYCNDNHTVEVIKLKNLCVYNLTLMFGAGNEPSSVEEFYQRIKGIPVDIYAYNEGEWIEWDTEVNPNDYLTFEALNDGVKLLYTKGTNTFKCSTDLGLTWQAWLPETYSPVLNAGDKLLVKCVNPTIDSTNGIGRIGNDEAGGPKYKVSGDIMSMIFGDDAAFNYSLAGYTKCFSGMLYSRNLVDAGDLILKATELSPYCYNQLFYGCGNNTRLPKELPAKTLVTFCYRFFSSGGLYTEMPVVKATSASDYALYTFLATSSNITHVDLSSIKEISNYALSAAFKNCTSLSFIKIGWTQWSNPSSLSPSWVEGVASQGTFVMPYNIEFDPESIRGTHGIPEGWELKYYDPDNIDDVRDNKEDFYPQERGR